MTNRVVGALWKTVAGLSLSLGCLGPLPQATAATISWGTAQTISGDSDINTTGTLTYAFSMGTSAVAQTTVNGVTFLPFGINAGFPPPTDVTVGDVTLAESPGNLFAYNTFGTATAPFSGLSSGYQSLVGTGAYADIPTTIDVTLAGLTPGQDYLVQWWTNNSANLTPILGGSFANTIADNPTGVTLDPNTTNQLGGVGQFAIGTFTADATTQVFTLEASSGFSPLINGLQVRAVPEPATYILALAGLAAGGRVVWHRRNRASRPPAA